MIHPESTQIYCVIMRCGTSKGIFLNENDLPQDPVLRDKVILSIFGSPDPRQIDGLGGADILTSKLALISAPSRPDADVDFSFGQVEINKPEIYYDGLCGNISSGVGTYAIEEGLVKAVEPVTKVRVHSKNTNQIYITEVPVKDGRPLVNGNYEVAGVPGTGAQIQIDMAGTVGSRTGKLLPTGNPVDKLDIEGFGKLDVSMLDVVNPCIFVRASDIGMKGDEKPSDVDGNESFMKLIDNIRIAAVKAMGLKDWELKNPTPFVVFVAPPKDYTDHLTGKTIRASEIDFLARMIILRKMHQTYAGSVSCVTGMAGIVPGTVVNEMARPAKGQKIIRIGHPAGVIDVEAECDITPEGVTARRVTYSRTARRIMEGYVYVPNHVFL
jgi:2-methylaconitate cis-trans-isomerase PrpF